MVMVIHSGTVPTWQASQPSVPDFSCGFQFHFSSGQRSRTLRVFFISSSNSVSMDCPMVIRSSVVKFEKFSAAILGEQKANCQALSFLRSGSTSSHTPPLPVELREHPIGHLELVPALDGALTESEDGRKWRYGTPVHHVLLERLHRPVSLLPEAERARDGAVSGRRTLRDSGCRIQFHRHRREAYGREYALPLDRFSDQRWRKARP